MSQRPLSVVVLIFLVVSSNMGGATTRPFTVAEEIGLAHFGDPYTAAAEAVRFSPNGRFFAVNTERGRLDISRPEGSLRIYRSDDVRNLLQHPKGATQPGPVWSFSRSTGPDGPIIQHWRWLADSSGIAFLEHGANGNDRLVFADVRKQTLEPLTPEDQAVRAFDIRSRTNYVYAVSSETLQLRERAERSATATVGTGRSSFDLLFPVSQYPNKLSWSDRSELWAVVDGRPIQLKDETTARPIVLFEEGEHRLALSPDGHSLITVLPVPEIPGAWETSYPPPFPSFPYRLRAERQDLQTIFGHSLVGQYVQINLQTGAVQALTGAPTAEAAGWWAGTSAPTWSDDGQAVLLPGTFLASTADMPSLPCVATFDRITHLTACVEKLMSRTETGYEAGYHSIRDARFEEGNRQRVTIAFDNRDNSSGTTEYQQTIDGAWFVTKQTADVVQPANADIQISVKQGLNDPPVLMATDRHTQVSRVIWDPNPRLKDVQLNEASVYEWKDRNGRDWKGGLFRPVAYTAGQRYPLVIQTHGFTTAQFRPSGLVPTAFAARALAAAGIAVLQVKDCEEKVTPEEGTCNVAGYEAAAQRLIADGLVDSSRIGIIGFSRSCFYVMEALTTSALHIQAASITDGVMESYMQYLTAVDVSGNGLANEYDRMVGARPFGDGLQQWLKRSPTFNMDKVTAPLQVVVLGRPSLLAMWEPYAALRYLHRPVDLVLLNSDEHVLTNPAVRMASQGGSVDWFRFWLQNYEDPDPGKAEQYTRWRELRKLQEALDVERVSASKEQVSAH